MPTPDPHTPFFSTTYIRLMHRLLGATDDVRLFAGTSSSADALARVDVEMSFDDQMAFCRNALELAGDDLGLRLGPQFQLASHGPLGTAMQTARSLDDAITCFGRHIALRASMFSLGLTRSGEHARATVECRGLPNDLLPLFTEGVLHSIAHCIGFFSGRPDAINGIDLNYPAPAYAEHYLTSFGAPTRFDRAQTSIRFDSDLLALASPTADARAHEQAVALCGGLLRQQSQAGKLSEQIEALLWNNPGKLWRLSELAPSFDCSSRTVIRRLRDEGTTFQAIRDDVLKQRALTLLDSGSVESTALALGFSDSASFRRSFKRWCGVPPNQRSTLSQPS